MRNHEDRLLAHKRSVDAERKAQAILRNRYQRRDQRAETAAAMARMAGVL
jgi:hypothetical protein